MKLENVIYCGDNLTWLKQFSYKCKGSLQSNIIKIIILNINEFKCN